MNGRIELPTLSVVIPVHQAEQYLPHCLDSILAEPADHRLEVVVVDDRSPDRSGVIADHYARHRDQRVRVIHLGARVGPGRARNLGLARARGQYVWFVDADDLLPPGSVAAVLDRLAQTRPDVLVVDHAEVFPDGQVVPGTPPGTLGAPPGAPPGRPDAPLGRPDAPPGGAPLTARPQLLRLAHSACTKLVRREFLARIGLRFHPGWYEDSAYNPALLLAAERIDVLDRVCYHYRQRRGGTITKSVSVRHFDVFAQYERMWRAVAATEPYPQFAPELFRLMVDHLLVIAGSGHRVPPRLRRDFFRRLAREYQLRLPATGYDRPGGVVGFKHRLVSWNAYEAYAALRLAWRVAGRARATLGPRRRATQRLAARPGRPVDQRVVGHREL